MPAFIGQEMCGSSPHSLIKIIKNKGLTKSIPPVIIRLSKGGRNYD
jgi:hypothetical protein